MLAKPSNEISREYPKVLYKAGGSQLVWGEMYTTHTVNNIEEEFQKLKEGFYHHPYDALNSEDPDDKPQEKKKPGRKPGSKL